MRNNAHCTVYNKYVDSATRTEKYQRTQICGVLWEDRKAANVIASGGNMAANQANIYIPYARGAAYKDPAAWQALVTKTGYWTLQDGDFIVRGLVSDEIHEAIPGSAGPPVVPAVPAFTISDLKAKYASVLSIKSVDTMDMGSSGMSHWQIGAA